VTNLKDDLHQYLTHARTALAWKLEDASEYDVRRPLTPTGTNLLGIVKHVASVTLGYFGETFDRPSGIPLPWFDDGAEVNADMWATEDETRQQIVDLYRRAWSHADATIEALTLDSVGQVPWWPEDRRRVTLGQVMVHMLAETERHAGQADVVRELIDGRAGWREEAANLPDEDEAWWAGYRDRVQRAAQEAARRAGEDSR
jgi:uncharacterized damage-inducible protein DinB